jgi:KaiC/GvpD/RAD55 family RecA-like ATPase
MSLMSFEEPEERLSEHMRNLGWDVDSYVKKGLIRVSRYDALDVSRSVEAL